jgi:hypothetical protein
MSDDEKVVYELTLDLPGQPKGEPVQIAGLGTFENGKSHQITESQAESYRSYNTRLEYEYDEDNNLVGATAEPGPTLLQAFSKTDGVEVTTVESRSANPPPPPAPKPAEGNKNDDGGDN